jgi:hypothetical protein
MKMSLSDLLGLGERGSLNGKSLPEFMNERTRPSKPKPDQLEEALAEHRHAEFEERRLMQAYDRQAMLERIRARRVHTFDGVPSGGVLERQHRINKRLAAVEAELTGDTNE